MRLLLDTHVYLWFLAASDRLPPLEYERIQEAEDVFVSAASVWEAAIKVRVGKLDVDLAELVRGITRSGFLELPVTATHAAGVACLPSIHADPFDRLLVAQALEGPLELVTADAVLAGYSDLVHVVS